MITNKIVTYYHKTFDSTNRIEVWNKTVFSSVWAFASSGANTNKGYNDANNISVRIPLGQVTDTSIFAIGDIIAIGSQDDIDTQQDLDDVEHYNVTSITINDFGNNPHIHLGGV